MSDAIGAMRVRVTLQSPMRVADEIGGAAIVWSNQGEVWAAIEADGANEAAGFDTAVASARYRVTINRRADVRAGWRVLWGARVLRVDGVADDGAARMSLACVEQRP